MGDGEEVYGGARSILGGENGMSKFNLVRGM
jgi:hypothetical protein